LLCVFFALVQGMLKLLCLLVLLPCLSSSLLFDDNFDHMVCDCCGNHVIRHEPISMVSLLQLLACQLVVIVPSSNWSSSKRASVALQWTLQLMHVDCQHNNNVFWVVVTQCLFHPKCVFRWRSLVPLSHSQQTLCKKLNGKFRQLLSATVLKCATTTTAHVSNDQCHFQQQCFDLDFEMFCSNLTARDHILEQKWIGSQINQFRHHNCC